MIARLLVEEDSRQSVREILERDSVTNAFIASRLHRWLDGSLSLSKLSGEFWVVEDGGSFEALLYVGANLVPTLCSEQAIDSLVGRLAQLVRRSTSITGPASVVLSLWERLEPSWGSARVIRNAQPLLVIDSAPLVEPDVDVRAVEPVELSLIFPSAVEMFTQEVGTSPLGLDNGASFRSRLAELILQGRAFARIENGEVLFKAEIGLSTPRAAQIQGVWTQPARRGEGIATSGMATVVLEALKSSDRVSLYVNDFNESALRVYEKVGFMHHGTLASVLF
ncbi:MAG: GNAT family N-acetyltransferase [Actinobacteria bacterium]|nr:GNAT family N-acetyltransferase [Actinomycetota bacterium]